MISVLRFKNWKVYFQTRASFQSTYVVEIEILKKKKKLKLKNEVWQKTEKIFFLNEHNIRRMWCKYGVNPINLVFRVAN